MDVNQTEYPVTKPEDLTFTSEKWVFDSPTQQLIAAIFLIIVPVIGIPGNALVVLAVILSRKLQTKTNAFVVSLAIADLVTCLSMPFNAFVITKGMLPKTVCALAAGMMWIGVGCSNISLALIALNRFTLITRSRDKYDKYFCIRNLVIMIIFSWIYPLILYVVPVKFILNGDTYSRSFKTCMTDQIAYFAVLWEVACLIIIFFCYVKIFKYISKRSHSLMRSMSTNNESAKMIFKRSKSTTSECDSDPGRRAQVKLFKRQVAVTKNLFVVVCLFLISLLPYTITSVFMEFTAVVYPIMPYMVLFLLLNSCINPILYGFKHPQFKVVFKRILLCQWEKISEPTLFLQKLVSPVSSTNSSDD